MVEFSSERNYGSPSSQSTVLIGVSTFGSIKTAMFSESEHRILRISMNPAVGSGAIPAGNSGSFVGSVD
jgi:hypothetical protein